MLFLRLLVLLLAVMTVVYVCVYHFLLAQRREKLESDYQKAATATERERFVEAQVKAYGTRIRPTLAVAVYAVPTFLLAVYIWASN